MVREPVVPAAAADGAHVLHVLHVDRLVLHELLQVDLREVVRVRVVTHAAAAAAVPMLLLVEGMLLAKLLML